MPTNLFMAYHDAMPRIRAERLLDAAQAAMAQFHKPAWWNAQLATASGDTEEAVAAASRPASAFRLNGQPVSHHELKGIIGTLGAGQGFDVSEERAA